MLTTWKAVSALDRVLDDVMGTQLGAATNMRTFTPDVDVRADEDKVVFVCDVPGLRLDDLEVTIENHVLTIRGERRFDGGEHEQMLVGRSYGAFTRSFGLPDFLDDEHLEAALADGVLTIRIPKNARAKPRRVHIGGGQNK